MIAKATRRKQSVRYTMPRSHVLATCKQIIEDHIQYKKKGQNGYQKFVDIEVLMLSLRTLLRISPVLSLGPNDVFDRLGGHKS